MSIYPLYDLRLMFKSTELKKEKKCSRDFFTFELDFPIEIHILPLEWSVMLNLP